MKLTDEQIKEARDEAYKKASHNAYFGNGFDAGVEFVLDQVDNSKDIDRRCELSEWIYDMNLQNLSNRKTPDEAFKEGIEVAIEEFKEAFDTIVVKNKNR